MTRDKYVSKYYTLFSLESLNFVASTKPNTIKPKRFFCNLAEAVFEYIHSRQWENFSVFCKFFFFLNRFSRHDSIFSYLIQNVSNY